MSFCPKEIKEFRKQYPELDVRMMRLAKFDNAHDGILKMEEADNTIERWMGYVEKDNSKKTYEKIDKELLMIKRGITGKEIIKNLEKKITSGMEKRKTLGLPELY